MLVGAACGLFIGIAIIFLLSFVVQLVQASPSALIYGALIGMASFALFLGIVGVYAGLRRETEEVRIVEKISWPAGKGRFSILMGLLVGAPVALVVGLAFGPLMGLLAGLTLGGTIGLLVLARHLVADEIDMKIIPNQGIRRSAHNALFTGLGVGLISALGVGLPIGLIFGSPFGLAFGAPFGVATGLLGSLFFGGEPCLQHVLIRAMLSRAGHMPRSYVRFLDYAAERIFLRKIGGAYIFVHRMLMEYFASLKS